MSKEDTNPPGDGAVLHEKAHPPDVEGLLKLYMSMTPAQRAERFADTSRAAEVAGVSRRAIQQWIASGTARAILIGRSYRVDMESLRLRFKAVGEEE